MSPWSDDCWFRLVEAHAVLGEEAEALCAHSRSFRTHCLGHTLDRHALTLDAPLGEEAALVEALAALVASYRPDLPRRRQRQTADRLAARRISTRWEGAAFAPALCGAASPTLCQRAYAGSLMSADQTQVSALCEAATGAAPDLAQVQAAGLPGWAPAGEALARQAWAELCAR